MKPASRLSLFVGVGIALALLHFLGLGLPILLSGAAVLLVITYFVPALGVRALDRVGLAWRAWLWRDQEGRHHAFGGVGLRIEDDGRHTWVAADDLQRALRTREPEDALAARHSDRWSRDADGRLWLRVDAVVGRLGTMPGRHDPRIQRLRRYFEREVLFPAAEKRRRAG